MSYTLPQMLFIPCKMTAGPRKMTAAPCTMLAATHLMIAKDQRGDLRSPSGPQGTPPNPILEKLLFLEMIFRTIGTKKNKKYPPFPPPLSDKITFFFNPSLSISGLEISHLVNFWSCLVIRVCLT